MTFQLSLRHHPSFKVWAFQTEEAFEHQRGDVLLICIPALHVRGRGITPSHGLHHPENFSNFLRDWQFLRALNVSLWSLSALSKGLDLGFPLGERNRPCVLKESVWCTCVCMCACVFVHLQNLTKWLRKRADFIKSRHLHRLMPTAHVSMTGRALPWSLQGN